MNGENAEMGYVVQAGMEGAAMLIKGSGKVVEGSMKLLQFALKRLRTGHLKLEEYSDLQKFMKVTNGNITYLNIPAENKEYKDKVREDLRKMNIPYHELPNLNAGNEMIQIVYESNYKPMVMPWFQTYCTQRLEEGNFLQQKTLSALSGGETQTGLITVPTEDPGLLRVMEKDFKQMNVSYCLMPDANVGDGKREVLYTKKDEEKIRHWLENFCQKHIVRGGELTAKELQVLAGDKGKVGFINIPMKSQKAIEKMKEEFQMMGVNYHLMEDMRTGDGLLQVMYLKKDEIAVRNWYSNYATDRLIKGGETSYKDLMNLTNGKTQIVSIPISKENLADMKADFKNLHINYTIMPQLKANDTATMLMYASADAERVRGWYSMYQEKILHETGEVLPDLEVVTMDQYTHSAEMNTDEYIKTEDPKQKAEAEEELRKELKEGTIKKNAPLNENPDYLRMDAMPEYEKITINESLVAGADYQKEGCFISRIPGMRDQYLVLSSKLVFESDFEPGKTNGKTYIAFLPKNSRHFVVDREGNPQKGLSTKELMEHYDPVTRDFSKTKVKKQGKDMGNTVDTPKFKK